MSEEATFSERPMNRRTPVAPVTIADVALRFVQDIPIYIVIVIVGMLAFKGTASAQEFIISGMGMLLSKSWPKAIALGKSDNHHPLIHNSLIALAAVSALLAKHLIL